MTGRATVETVLVVDDRPVDRRLLRTLLEHRGHRVVEASDGAEGLRRFRGELPGLVVTDVVLPGMGGYELARRLRADPDSAGTGIILCSAHFRPEECEELATALGVSGVLAKPVEPHDLYRAVDGWFDGRGTSLPAQAPVPPQFVEVLSGKLFEKVQQLELLSGDRQALLGVLVRTQEDERRSVAGALHDDAVQVMFGAALMLENLAKRTDDPETAEAGRAIADELLAAGGRLRRLMHDLLPPSTGGRSLAQALTTLLERAAVAGGFSGTLAGDPGSDPSDDQFTVVYRIVQEALANVERHARASRVEVTLTGRDGGVAVRVHDDGQGCPPDRLRAGGIGLTAMRERAELAGGWWRLESAPPQPGTLVEFWIPLDPA